MILFLSCFLCFLLKKFFFINNISRDSHDSMYIGIFYIMLRTHLSKPPVDLQLQFRSSYPGTGFCGPLCSWGCPSPWFFLCDCLSNCRGSCSSCDLTLLMDLRRAVGFSVCSAFHLLPRQSHSFQAVLETGGQPCPTRSGGSSLEREGQLPKAAWEQQGRI